MTGRSCPAHLAWLRTLPCSVPKCRAPAPSEAHHVRLGTDGGTGLKPSDKWAVPLCHRHHRQLHQVGQVTFNSLHAIDLKTEAEWLAARSPALKR